MGTVVDLPHKQLNMKVMGFVVSLWHAASSPSLELPLPSLTQSALHSLPLVDLSLPPEPRPPPSRPPLSSPARPSSSRGSSSTSCSRAGLRRERRRATSKCQNLIIGYEPE